ncbi:MAG: substrate-binding domain-containing protein [Treponema sp.]|nr:substrate-binding domain-containing protein [Treponema sp.]
MKNSRILCAVFAAVFMLSGYQLFARGRTDATAGRIILSTTTSTYDSGLLGHILPVFTAETGWAIDVISVGTGAALQMGRDGQADVLLVHAKAQELQFVADGYGVERFDVMYNDFVIVGPPGFIAHNADVSQTLRAIIEQNLPFISRGDNSGTHIMELSLWNSAGVDPSVLSDYLSVGQGMGATLRMANEMLAFTLTDRATWLSQSPPDLVIVCEGDAPLLNLYGVIAVNPAIHRGINAEGARVFIDWILRPSTQELISTFGMVEFGEPLFFPNAQR